MAQNRHTKKQKDIFVSVCIVPRLRNTDIAIYLMDLSQQLASAYRNYEIIIIDNDIEAESIETLSGLLTKLPCVRIVRLARRYAHDTAVIAGLEAAIGDYVVVVDPAVEDSSLVPKIIEQNEHYDIVQGVADVSEKRMRNAHFGRRLFYWYNRRYLKMDIPANATYFIALSRRAVRAITTSSRFNGYVRHIIKSIGYTHTQFIYKTKEDPIRSTSLRTGSLEALDVVTSHSTQPLRMMSWVGFFASILNLIYVGYIFIVPFIKGEVAEGWTTMSLQLSGMFFLLFLFMIVLSEYVGKILDETRHDSRYIVMDELLSTVSFAEADRKNISKD